MLLCESSSFAIDAILGQANPFCTEIKQTRHILAPKLIMNKSL